jgi:small subunit ribosomal protein S11
MASKQKTLTIGKVNVLATFNNTLISVSDLEGNLFFQESAGSCGFKGARKATPYAATVATEKALVKAKQVGLKEADVYIKGPGVGRDAALRAVRTANVKIRLIADMTPIPHNGVRPREKRRI